MRFGFAAPFLLWAARHPGAVRVIALALLLLCVLLGQAVPAHADDGSTVPDPGVGLTDSKDVQIEKYTVLPQDRGGWDNWGKSMNGWFLDLFWQMLHYSMVMLIWLLQWTLSFEWVDRLTKPFQDLSANVQNFTGGINWIPFALMIAAVVCGIAMVRGKIAGGLMNIVISCLLAVGATGMLANPSTMVFGPGGALDQVKQRGGQIAVAVSTDGTQNHGDLTPTKIINQSVVKPLVDIMLRHPSQLISFGKILDGPCNDVFTEKMKAAPTANAGDNSVRDAVAACDPEVASFIKYPFGQFVTAFVVGQAVLYLALLAVFLAGVLILTVLWAGYQTVLFGVKLLAAIIPTDNRGGVWKTGMDLVVSLALVGASIIFLTLYLKMIVAMSEATKDLGQGQYPVIDILFVGGIIAFWIIRRKLKKAGESVAERLSRLGLGSAVKKQPVNMLGNMASLGRTYSDLKTMGNKMSSRKGLPVRREPQPMPKPQPLPSPGTSGPGGSGYMPQLGPGQPQQPGPGGGSSANAPSGALRALGAAAMKTAALTPTPVGAAAKTAMAVSGGVSRARSLAGAGHTPAGAGHILAGAGHTTSGGAPEGPSGPATTRRSYPMGPPARRTSKDTEVLTGRIVDASVGPAQPTHTVRTARNSELRDRLAAMRTLQTASRL